MTRRWRPRCALCLFISFSLAAISPLQAQSPAPDACETLKALDGSIESGRVATESARVLLTQLETLARMTEEQAAECDLNPDTSGCSPEIDQERIARLVAIDEQVQKLNASIKDAESYIKTLNDNHRQLSQTLNVGQCG